MVMAGIREARLVSPIAIPVVVVDGGGWGRSRIVGEYDKGNFF